MTSSTETIASTAHVLVFDAQEDRWLSYPGGSAKRILGMEEEPRDEVAYAIWSPRRDRAIPIPTDKIERLKQHWPFVKRCEFVPVADHVAAALRRRSTGDYPDNLGEGVADRLRYED